MIDLRLPRITESGAPQTLPQMWSYIIQLTDALNFAMLSVEKKTEDVRQTVTRATGAGTPPEKQAADRFNEVKSLIIKSAEIVNAYYEKISASMEGNYEALSQFGAFKESTQQNVEMNSTSITQLLSSVQEMTTEIDGLRRIVSDAYIRSGQLGYDAQGIPIVGLEIGQRSQKDGQEVFNRYARFTSGKLSFYDANDVEVAYVSDYRLYITDAVIRGELSIGGYVTDTTYGLAFLWN